jgi:hypothetical protein
METQSGVVSLGLMYNKYLWSQNLFDKCYIFNKWNWILQKKISIIKAQIWVKITGLKITY